MISTAIYEELVKFRDTSISIPEGPTEMIKYLTEQGYIKSVKNGYFGELTIRPIEWSITIEGLSALSEFEDERDKQAENKRQQHIQNQISIAQILISFAIFILGLIVEYRTGIIGIIAKLFG